MHKHCKKEKECCFVPIPGPIGVTGPTGLSGIASETGATGPIGPTGPDGGDINAQNVGIGTGLVFRDKTTGPSGTFFNFRTLKATGSSITGSYSGGYLDIFDDPDNNEVDFTISATPFNIPNTIVSRDGTGSFAAQSATLYGNLILVQEPSTSLAGVIYKNDPQTWIHDAGAENMFTGLNAGNLTISGSGNSGFGYQALENITTGFNNTAIGANALLTNDIGNNNTAVGSNVLSNNIDTGITAVGAYALNNYIKYVGGGGQNTAVGTFALASSVEGNSNTAVGWSALTNDVTLSDSGENTAVGALALYANTTGTNNTAVGYDAGSSLTIGSYNTAIGASALDNNTIGANNIAIGPFTAFSSVVDSDNIAIGFQALYNNETDQNLAIGSYAMFTNSTGTFNTAVGYQCLEANNIGSRNTGVGYQALLLNSYNLAAEGQPVGASNTAVGCQAMVNNLAAYNCVAVGDSALLNGGGLNNTAIGISSALSLSGSGAFLAAIDNTCVGAYTAVNLVTGSFNTILGSSAGFNYTSNETGNILINSGGVAGENNTLRINVPPIINPLAATYIDGIYSQSTTTNSTLVFIDSNGKLGTSNSVAGTYVQTVEADMGSATASSGTIFLHANTAGANSGATVSFSASTDVVNLNTTDSSNNVTIGANAGGINVVNGTFNTSVGGNSLNLANGASDNTALGYDALNSLISGTGTIAIGANAGSSLTSSESNNIYIGNVGVNGESGAIRIGATGTQVTNYQQGIRGVTPINAAIPVYIATDGQLGTAPSLRSLKENIEAIDAEENRNLINKLIPRTFNYKDNHIQQYGFIVDEVPEVLIAYDINNKPETIYYQHIPIILTKEIQRLGQLVDKQEQTINTLTELIQEQRKMIDKLL
jgi:hypothetical protein